jgi:arsenate reductase (thioredoxin)
MVPRDPVKGGFRGTRHRFGGPRKPGAQLASSPQPAVAKKRVLFVCIGNSCRSQMAEAFARAYGADVMEPLSAGLSPAAIIAPLTRQTLLDRNVRVEGQFPKGLELFPESQVDLVVNMSGAKLGLGALRVVEWQVQDPIGQSAEVYRTVASQIEHLVMGLILELRSPTR